MREKGARCVYTRHSSERPSSPGLALLRRRAKPFWVRPSCGRSLAPSGLPEPAEPRGTPTERAARFSRESASEEAEPERAGEHRFERGGDMRTYWLHSVWVLGFFLFLFSLQGKWGGGGGGPGGPRLLAPSFPPTGLGGGVGGVRSARNVDGTRLIYKCCGALPALAAPRPPGSRGVQECADRLAALSLLVGRFGTGVCVRECVCVRARVRVCVCVGGGGRSCEGWWRRSWGCSSVNSKRHRGVRCPRVPGADTTAFLLFQEGIGFKFRGRKGMHLAQGTYISVQNNPYRFDSKVGEGSGWRAAGGWRERERDREKEYEFMG